MRTAVLVVMSVLMGACFRERYGEREHRQQVVSRDAVLIDGTRVEVQENSTTGQMVVVRPQNLSGMLVVVDPGQRRSDMLVVRPVGQADNHRRQEGEHHDRDHDRDRERGSGGY